MNVGKTNLAILNVSFFDLTPRASGKSPAERSLKIAELDQRHGSFRITSKMTCLGYQVRHHFGIPAPSL